MQPQLAKAHKQGKIQVEESFPITSIVKGLAFVLVELESVEALGLISIASQGLVVDGLDEGWNDTFIATYFFVRIGKSTEGATRLQTRMIEGPLEVNTSVQSVCRAHTNSGRTLLPEVRPAPWSPIFR